LAIDANVYVARFTQEEFSRQARDVFGSGAALIGPDFIGIEVASAFLKKVRAGDMSLSDATIALEILPRIVRLESSAELWTIALKFARDYGLSAYDALYTSLALRERCRLVTADRQIRGVLRAQAPSTLAWLEDFDTP
jgi:predicted nucleic acid-binding protein